MNPSSSSCASEAQVGKAALSNLPYALMILLGVAALLLALGPGGSAWWAAGGYLAYGLLGPLWIILFLCPHCPSYGHWSCPCGYGIISARLRPAGDTSRFRTEFKRHIAVIVPLWIIPLVPGGLALARGFSWPLAVVMAAFAINSYVVLPLVSKRHGCGHCEQREQCPWMKH